MSALRLLTIQLTSLRSAGAASLVAGKRGALPVVFPTVGTVRSPTAYACHHLVIDRTAADRTGHFVDNGRFFTGDEFDVFVECQLELIVQLLSLIHI